MEEAACANFSLTGVDEGFECVNAGLRIFHGVFMGAILLANLILNSTVLAMVYKYKQLRRKSVLVTLGLVLADMSCGVVWVFQAEASTIAGEWPFSDTTCTVFAYFYLTLLFVRWCEVLAFTSDRFCQILFPFWYQRWCYWLIAISTIVAWLVPALTSLPTTILGFASFYLTLTACSVNCDLSDTNEGCSQGVIALFAIYIAIGSIIPTIMYITIYLYGWRKKTNMKRKLSMGTGEGLPKRGTDGENFMQKFSKERRALMTCLLVFITNISTTTLIYITTALRSRDTEIPLEVHYLAMYLFLIGTALDPLVIMRTKDFRDKFTRRKIQVSHSISKALHNVIDLGLPDDYVTSIKVSNLANGGTSTTVETSGINLASNGSSSDSASNSLDNSHTDC